MANFSTSIPDEPHTIIKTNKHPEWREAMASKFRALQNTHTWTLVSPPPNANIMSVKWVYKTKRHADGRIERQKARYHQQEGIDYTNTFCPVAKPSIIRALLSLAIMRRWSVRQLDIQNSFLHDDLNEEVYISQPPGFIHPSLPNSVCKLYKSL